MRSIDITEDRALLGKLRSGSGEALRPIYEKYKADMFAFALTMCRDRTAAEDVVHDVFVSFAGIARSLKLKTNLKGYLLTSIANRIRNIQKAGSRRAASIGNLDPADLPAHPPAPPTIAPEEAERLQRALAELPDSQREVIILHHLEGLRFRSIAKSQGESINTVQSRYRYGMQKMRTFFGEEGENV